MQIRPLNDEEVNALNEGLKLAAHLVSSALPLSMAEVQSLYDAIRNNHHDNTDAQIALGLAFGELITENTDYKWVRVHDEYGEETALSPPGVQVACHPISMLQKRVSKKEDVNIEELRDGTIKSVENLRTSEKFNTA